MVDVFGNEIIGAYTNGVAIQAIYAYGNLVWPVGPSPKVSYIYNDNLDKFNTEPYEYAPYIEILFPDELTEYKIKLTYANNFKVEEINSRIIALKLVAHYGDNDDTYNGWGWVNGRYISSSINNKLTVGYNFNGKETANSVNTYGKKTTEITQDKIDAGGVSVNRPSEIDFGEKYTINYIGLTGIRISRDFQGYLGFPYIYGMKMYGTGDELIMDLVPFFDTSSNRAGMYDLINNVFYDGHYRSYSKDFKYVK